MTGSDPTVASTCVRVPMLPFLLITVTVSTSVRRYEFRCCLPTYIVVLDRCQRQPRRDVELPHGFRGLRLWTSAVFSIRYGPDQMVPILAKHHLWLIWKRNNGALRQLLA
jgi:hypothetical protein